MFQSSGICPLLVQLTSPGCICSPDGRGVIASCNLPPPSAFSSLMWECHGKEAGGCVSKCRGLPGSGEGQWLLELLTVLLCSPVLCL